MRMLCRGELNAGALLQTRSFSLLSNHASFAESESRQVLKCNTRVSFVIIVSPRCSCQLQRTQEPGCQTQTWGLLFQLCCCNSLCPLHSSSSGVLQCNVLTAKPFSLDLGTFIVIQIYFYIQLSLLEWDLTPIPLDCFHYFSGLMMRFKLWWALFLFYEISCPKSMILLKVTLKELARSKGT